MALLTFTRTVGPARVFELHGALDDGSKERLAEQVAEAMAAGNRLLLFDLGKLSFVSSAGLAVFLGAHRRMHAAGGHVRFAALQDAVRLVFQVTGLTALLEIYDTVEDALVGPSVNG